VGGQHGSSAAGLVANLSPVTIGNVGTYSGIIGSIFHSGAGAALLVAKYINAHGGLNGHPINMVSADDGGDPARNASIVKQMVETQHAMAWASSPRSHRRAAPLTSKVTASR
jgi:branched-chain amino acid transport system substrate-binding protein